MQEVDHHCMYHQTVILSPDPCLRFQKSQQEPEGIGKQPAAQDAGLRLEKPNFFQKQHPKRRLFHQTPLQRSEKIAEHDSIASNSKCATPTPPHFVCASKAADLPEAISTAVIHDPKLRKATHARAVQNGALTKASQIKRKNRRAHGTVARGNARSKAGNTNKKPVHWIDKPWAELPRMQTKDTLKLSPAPSANVRVNPSDGSSARSMKVQRTEHPACSASAKPADPDVPGLAAIKSLIVGKVSASHRRFQPHAHRRKAQLHASAATCTSPVSIDSPQEAEETGNALFQKPRRNLAAIRRQARSCF